MCAGVAYICLSGYEWLSVAIFFFQSGNDSEKDVSNAAPTGFHFGHVRTHTFHAHEREKCSISFCCCCSLLLVLCEKCKCHRWSIYTRELSFEYIVTQRDHIFSRLTAIAFQRVNFHNKPLNVSSHMHSCSQPIHFSVHVAVVSLSLSLSVLCFLL